MDKDVDSKETEYKDSKKVLESAKGVVHLIGDFGIGKTHLIKSLIEEKIVFDDFLFKESKYGLIKLHRDGKDFSTQVKKYENYQKSKKWLKIMITTLLSLSPLSFIVTDNLKWWQFSPLFLVGIFAVIWLGMLICINKKEKFPSNYKNLYIENVDRFDWDTIYLLFKWSYKNKNNFNKIVFTYSTNNLAERYKEKYGFYPKNLELTLDKFVDLYIDLNTYKSDVAHLIFHKITKDLNISDLDITNIDNLNFRIVQKCTTFIKENKEIIEVLKLDKKTIFLIQYLFHSNKIGYYWLKKNIWELKNWKIIHTYKRWFEDVFEFDEAMNEEINHELDPMGQNPVGKIKKEDTPEFLKEAEGIIRIIYESFTNLGVEVNNEWNNYFINASTKDIFGIIKEKNTSKLIQKYGVDEKIKIDLLKGWYKLSSKIDKIEIYKYIVSKFRLIDKVFLVANFKEIIETVGDVERAEFINYIWKWCETNTGVTKLCANNYSITPYIYEYLLGKDFKNNKIEKLLRESIKYHLKQLKEKNELIWETKEEWYIYETIILRKFFKHNDENQIKKMINQSQEVQFAGMLLKEIGELSEFDIKWKIKGNPWLSKYNENQEIFNEYFKNGQKGYKEIHEIIKKCDFSNAIIISNRK